MASMRISAAWRMGMRRMGFVVVVPAIFDRFERGLELKYEGPRIRSGRLSCTRS